MRGAVVAIAVAACSAKPAAKDAPGEPTKPAPTDAMVGMELRELSGPPTDVIDGVVRAHEGELRACFASGLASWPVSGGAVIVDFTVAPDGTVGGVSITGGELARDPIAPCVTAAVAALHFAASDEATPVSFSFRFWSGSGSTPKPTAKPPPVDIRLEAQVAFHPASGPRIEAIDRVIRARSGIWRACYQRAVSLDPTVSGTLTASLTIGADGGVVAAEKIDGTFTNDGLVACMTRNLQRLHFPAGTATPQRYRFEFTTTTHAPSW